MKVSECMTCDVRVANPGETVQAAARMMAQIDAGILPVCENDRLIGMITDRDIAIRAVGHGWAPDTNVRDVMSDEVRYCYDDDDVGDILYNMEELQLRRMPVLNHDKRLVGIISISDFATHGITTRTGETLGEIARPSGLHSQAA